MPARPSSVARQVFDALGFLLSGFQFCSVSVSLWSWNEPRLGLEGPGLKVRLAQKDASESGLLSTGQSSGLPEPKF